MKRAAIDWPDVHRRLRASEALLEQALTPSARYIEDAYRRRAVKLASRPAQQAALSARLRVMAFRLGQERYAVELKHVAEVVPFAGCTPVPGAPSNFPGVIHVRGELRAVLSLSRLLGVAEEPESASNVVLLLNSPGREIGCKVDRVEGFRDLSADEVLPAPGSYLKGLAPGTLLLLDVEAVLAEVFSNEESVA